MRAFQHLLLCGLLLLMGLFVKAQTAPEEDVVMTVLQQELTKEFAVLSKREFPVVYMAFSVDETRERHLKAMMGSPMDDFSDHSRYLRIELRVGSPHSVCNSGSQMDIAIPLNDYDELLFRKIIDSRVQSCYAAAVLKYRQHQIERRYTLFPSDEFVPPTFSFHYEEPVADWNFDGDTYMNYLCQTTSKFDALTAGIAYATLNYTFTRTWFVDSEGSYVAKNSENTDFELKIQGRNADGRHVSINRQVHVDSPIKLPQDNELNGMVEDLSRAYDEKRISPMDSVSEFGESISFLSAYDPHHDQIEESFSDMVFRALRDEVEEVDWELQDKEMPRPYQSSYQVVNGRNFQMVYHNGALFKNVQQPVCYLNSRVLLGSNKMNNDGVDWDYDESNTMSLPLNGHYDNFRRVLRLSEDEAYQRAWKEYEYKNVLLNSLPPEVLINRPQDRASANALQYDAGEEYECTDLSRLESISSELAYILSYGFDSLLLENKEDYFDHFSSVEVNGCQADVCYYSTDGIRTKQPFSVMCLRLFVHAKTPDGMGVSDYENVYFKKIDDLPDMTDLRDRAVALRNRVKDLSVAPSMQTVYDGPVIVSDDAAAQLFAYAFADKHGLYAYRNPLHEGNRTAFSGNVLEESVDKQVTNTSLDVDAVDTRYDLNGPLIGYYLVDAEGVKVPQKVELIARGELNNLLTTRVPTRKFKNSNGHCRLSISGGKLVPMGGVF